MFVCIQKTTAHRRYVDDVPNEIKLKRVADVYAEYRKIADELNKEQIGEYQLILIEGVNIPFDRRVRVLYCKLVDIIIS